jgi:hypothetical protein
MGCVIANGRFRPPMSQIRTLARSRSVPIDPDRSRSQPLADVERLNIWDHDSGNVWSLPLKPLLDALGQQQEEKRTDAKK